MLANVPVLGICYGQQAMVKALGGQVSPGRTRQFGRAEVKIVAHRLFEGVWTDDANHIVWMSHGDRVDSLPDRIRSRRRVRRGAPYAFIADESRALYAVQFHPEVVHTPDGRALIENFVLRVAGAKPGVEHGELPRNEDREEIRAQVGQGRVICGLSGGVDSAVAAVLIHEAIGDQLTCVFVDHGLMRLHEAEQVVQLFRDHYNIPLVHVDAEELFLGGLAVTDPVKRKFIGKTFIDVFEAEAKKIGGAKFLAQGTLYPDVIESVSFTGGPSVTIEATTMSAVCPNGWTWPHSGTAARTVQG